MSRGTHFDEELDPEPREEGLWFGQVVDVADPEKRGRVKILVPGLTATSTTWAEPVGLPGAGGPGQGEFSVPPVGATVLVGFLLGDLDSPVFWSGPYARDEQPERAREVPASEVAKLFVKETPTFEISIDETEDRKLLRIRNKVSNDVIEMNAADGPAGKSHTISIQASTSLSIKALGAIEIDAAVVQIKGRLVTPGTRPI
jgi:hypothetical protein